MAGIQHIRQESETVALSSQIKTFTTTKSLYDSSDTTTQASDRRLPVEASAIQEMQNKCETDIQWLRQEKQLTDCLTKKGLPTIPSHQYYSLEISNSSSFELVIDFMHIFSKENKKWMKKNKSPSIKQTKMKTEGECKYSYNFLV